MVAAALVGLGRNKIPEAYDPGVSGLAVLLEDSSSGRQTGLAVSTRPCNQLRQMADSGSPVSMPMAPSLGAVQLAVTVADRVRAAVSSDLPMLEMSGLGAVVGGADRAAQASTTGLQSKQQSLLSVQCDSVHAGMGALEYAGSAARCSADGLDSTVQCPVGQQQYVFSSLAASTKRKKKSKKKALCISRQWWKRHRTS